MIFHRLGYTKVANEDESCEVRFCIESFLDYHVMGKLKENKSYRRVDKR